MPIANNPPEWYVLTPDEFLYEGCNSTAYEPSSWSPLPNPANSSNVQLMVRARTVLITSPTHPPTNNPFSDRLGRNSNLPPLRHFGCHRCPLLTSSNLGPISQRRWRRLFRSLRCRGTLFRNQDRRRDL